MTYGEQVTRRRNQQTGVDRYDNPIFELVDTALEETAAFSPGGSVETASPERITVVTKPTLYFLRAWPDLTEDDVVIVRGVEYQIDGKPADWRDPWGSENGGLVVELKKAGG